MVWAASPSPPAYTPHLTDQPTQGSLRDAPTARAAAAATVKTLFALSDTLGAAAAPNAGARGVDAHRPPLPETRDLIQRFRRRLGGVDAHTTVSPQPRFRHHYVGSLRNRRSADTSRPSRGTVGDAQNPADQ
jgi:hypothetical protein